MDDPTYFLAGAVVRRYVDLLNFDGKVKGDGKEQPLLTLRMVSFLPGRNCRAGPGVAADEEIANEDEDFSNAIRCSFAFYEPEELAEGVRRLRAGYDDYMKTLA